MLTKNVQKQNLVVIIWSTVSTNLNLNPMSFQLINFKSLYNKYFCLFDPQINPVRADENIYINDT